MAPSINGRKLLVNSGPKTESKSCYHNIELHAVRPVATDEVRLGRHRQPNTAIAHHTPQPQEEERVWDWGRHCLLTWNLPVFYNPSVRQCDLDEVKDYVDSRSKPKLERLLWFNNLSVVVSLDAHLWKVIGCLKIYETSNQAPLEALHDHYFAPKKAVHAGQSVVNC